MYCLAHQVEVGRGLAYGGFEIEHFKPASLFGNLRTVYANLLWACRECNKTKSNKWPNEEDLDMGCRFVDPTQEALGKHLELQGDFVVAKTRAGEYMIDELNLNSQIHKERRAERRQNWKSWKTLREAIDAGRIDPAQKEQLQQLADSLLENFIGEAVPWDAVEDCLCPLRPKAKR